MIEIPPCETGGQESKETTAVGATIEKAGIVLSPNPAKEQVTITYKALPAEATIAVYDLTGRNLAVYSSVATEGSLIVPTSTYPAGIYLVVVRGASGLIAQQKLIIE